MNNLQIIESFKDLKENWDSYRAETINSESIKTAIYVLNWIESCIKVFQVNGLLKYNIYPMRDGGIQFELDCLKCLCEIEVNGSKIVFLKYDFNGNLIQSCNLSDVESVPYLIIN